MPRTHRRRSPRAAALLGAAAAAVALAGPLPAAQGATDSWDCWLSSGYYCNSERHSLRAVSNWNPSGYTSGAAASPTGSAGNLYGSWAWGGGYACHSYAGSNILYPLIKNGSGSGASRFYGTSTYGTGAQTC